MSLAIHFLSAQASDTNTVVLLVFVRCGTVAQTKMATGHRSRPFSYVDADKTDEHSHLSSFTSFRNFSGAHDDARGEHPHGKTSAFKLTEQGDRLKPGATTTHEGELPHGEDISLWAHCMAISCGRRSRRTMPSDAAIAITHQHAARTTLLMKLARATGQASIMMCLMPSSGLGQR